MIDVAFKQIFGKEKNKRLVEIGLLNFGLPDATGKDEGFVHRYSIRNDRNGMQLTDALRFSVTITLRTNSLGKRPREKSQEGVSIDIIQRVTGLSAEEITDLNDQFK